MGLRDLSTSSTESGPNLEELLQIATTTLKQGNKQGAEVIIRQVIEADKYNDRAWVLLAGTTDDPLERRRWLQQALRINPNNQTARRALEKMEQVQANVKDLTVYYGTIGLVIALAMLALACVLVLLIN
ncbi:MAG: hypothetical protein CUN55_07485 [Phototrophicales bacterium]|nr:MAG: hypothetical protein CUN55_07485 [Phototrophicales bacterium]